MTKDEFFSNQEMSIVQFAYSLIQDIENRVREFRTKNKLDNYLHMRAKLFLEYFTSNVALRVVYENEIISIVYAKIKNLLKEFRVFSVI